VYLSYTRYRHGEKMVKLIVYKNLEFAQFGEVGIIIMKAGLKYNSS
jgi:hypothetical protein